MGVGFSEEGREWMLPSFLHSNDLILFSESEEDVKLMVGRIVEVSKRSCLKENSDKSKVMV